VVEPAGDLGTHVGREVVQHDVDGKVAGHVQIDELEEGEDVFENVEKPSALFGNVSVLRPARFARQH
jgi:hypothetical protein